jgi:hypothetical protein
MDKDLFFTRDEIYSNRPNMEKKLMKDVEDVVSKQNLTVVNITQFPRLVGEVDDTARIRRAIASINVGETLLLPNVTEWYTISDTIVVDKNINVLIEGKISYAGSRDKTALKFSGLSKCTIKLNQLYDVNSVKDSYVGFHGWADNKYTGVELENLKHCYVHLEEVRNFTTGVRCKASSGKGFWFNEITIDELANNKIQLDLNSDGENSWMNSNYFYATSFTYSGSGLSFMSGNFERYAILQTLTNGNKYGGNSNYFFRQKFETHGTFGGSFTQIKILKATDWVFSDYRVELLGTNTKFAVIDLAENDSTIQTKAAHTNGVLFYPSFIFGDHTIEFVNTGNIKVAYSEVARVAGVNSNKEYQLLGEEGFRRRYRWYAANHHTIEGVLRKPLQSTTYNDETNFDYSSVNLSLDNGVDVRASYPIVFYVSNVKKGDEISIQALSADGSTPNFSYKMFDKTNTFCADGLINGNRAIAHYGSWNTANNLWKPYAPRIFDKFTVNSDDVGTVVVLVYGYLNGVKLFSTNPNNVVKKTVNPTVYKHDGIYVHLTPTRTLDGNFMPEEIVYNKNNAAGQHIGWKLVNNAGTLSWQSLGTYPSS